MPIPIPNLDDHNYDQMLKETAGVIARYFPEYADIGPSDPAMAVNELFCYLFDIAMYQINRITPDARNNFAALLGIQPVYGQPPEESLRQALDKLSRIERAVTSGDIEIVLKKASLDKQLCSEPVRRVRVIPGKSAGDPVRVFVVQKGAFRVAARRHRKDLRSLYSHLRGCSPLGTRYLIVHSPLLRVDVSAEIVKRRDSTISSDKLAADIEKKLSAYMDPLTGGDSGDGWEFGKAVSRGDIYGLIEGMPGVDHVKLLYIKKSDDACFGTDDTLPLPEGGLLKLQSSTVTVS